MRRLTDSLLFSEYLFDDIDTTSDAVSSATRNKKNGTLKPKELKGSDTVQEAPVAQKEPEGKSTHYSVSLRSASQRLEINSVASNAVAPSSKSPLSIDLLHNSPAISEHHANGAAVNKSSAQGNNRRHEKTPSVSENRHRDSSKARDSGRQTVSTKKVLPSPCPSSNTAEDDANGSSSRFRVTRLRSNSEMTTASSSVASALVMSTKKRLRNGKQQKEPDSAAPLTPLQLQITQNSALDVYDPSFSSSSSVSPPARLIVRTDKVPKQQKAASERVMAETRGRRKLALQKSNATTINGTTSNSDVQPPALLLTTATVRRKRLRIASCGWMRGRKRLALPDRLVPTEAATADKPRKVSVFTNMWRCVKCNVEELADAGGYERILEHLKKTHAVSPFYCKQCSFGSMRRLIVHRHIKDEQHGTSQGSGLGRNVCFIRSLAASVLAASPAVEPAAAPAPVPEPAADQVDQNASPSGIANSTEKKLRMRKMRMRGAQFSSLSSNAAQTRRTVTIVDITSERQSTNDAEGSISHQNGVGDTIFRPTDCGDELNDEDATHAEPSESSLTCRPKRTGCETAESNHERADKESPRPKSTTEPVGNGNGTGSEEADHGNESSARRAVLLACDTCPFLTRSSVVYTAHVNTHRPLSPNHFQCKNCTYSARNLDFVKRHMVVHRPDYIDWWISKFNGRNLRHRIDQICAERAAKAASSSNGAEQQKAGAGLRKKKKKKSFIVKIREESVPDLAATDVSPTPLAPSGNVLSAPPAELVPDSSQASQSKSGPEQQVEAAKQPQEEEKHEHQEPHRVDTHDDSVAKAGEKNEQRKRRRVARQPWTKGRAKSRFRNRAAIKTKIGPESKVYNCNKCPYKSRQSARFSRHLAQHDAGASSSTSATTHFRCHFCDYSADQASIVALHETMHSTSTSTDVNVNAELDADECKWQFQMPCYQPPMVYAALRISKRSTSQVAATGDRVRACENVVTGSLEAGATDSSPLSGLMIDRLSNGAFRCPRCPFIDADRLVLLRHLARHIPESHPSTCPFCDYRVVSATDAKQHVALHVGHVISVADESPEDEVQLQQDDGDKQSIEAVFSSVRLHLTRMPQSRTTTQNETEADSKSQLVCYFCDRADFSDADAYRRHLAAHQMATQADTLRDCC